MSESGSERVPVLLVDDDPMMIEIEKFQMGEESYRFLVAGDGIEALELLAREKPAVILLDVTMPRLDGLETCRRIRADPSNDSIHILFITARDDAETHRVAYDCGGDDVLAKPLNPSVLLSKVERVLRIQKQVSNMRRDMTETMGMLMSAITTSGKYGVVMNALRQAMGCRSVGDLAEVMLKALEEFGINGSVQLRTGQGMLTLNSERRSSPLEQEMLHKLSLENRHIYDYGNRTAFCFPHTAILVKNMPLDNPEEYGRIKDNVALLAEGAELRLEALAEEMNTRQQRETLAGSAALVAQILDRVDVQFKRGQSEMAAIFGELEQGLEWTLSGMGLTDGQEDSVWRLVRPLADRAAHLYDEGVGLDQQLAGALETLRLSLAEGGRMGQQDIWFD